MRFAVIDKNGFVSNVIEAEHDFVMSEVILIASVDANIGDQYNGFTGNFETFVPEEPLPSIADYQAAIDAHVDAVAVARNYSGAVSISTYATSTVPQWASEAATFIAWRDQVWLYAYGELDKVNSGGREQVSIADFIAELPVITW